LTFFHIHTPIITSNICEGASEIFQVNTAPTRDDSSKFFKSPAFLSPSAQLHLEAAASGLMNVYTMNPTFRAEKSRTSHHLCEFTMLEVEMAFESDFNCMMIFVEELLKHCVYQVISKCSEEIKFLFQEYHQKTNTLQQDMQVLFEKISYSDAIVILKQAEDGTFKRPVKEWGQELASEHEQYLAKKFNGPLFIYDYPAEGRAFYMKEESLNIESNSRKIVQNFDLIFPYYGELCGGSLREHRLDRLQSKIDSLGLNKNGELDWYIELRKYGTTPHGGFGIGFDRLLQYITGFANIRDVAFMARTPGSLMY
jgi:asparaginyl-tRNA synthetase